MEILPCIQRVALPTGRHRMSSCITSSRPGIPMRNQEVQSQARDPFRDPCQTVSDITARTLSTPLYLPHPRCSPTHRRPAPRSHSHRHPPPVRPPTRHPSATMNSMWSIQVIRAMSTSNPVQIMEESVRLITKLRRSREVPGPRPIRRVRPHPHRTTRACIFQCRHSVRKSSKPPCIMRLRST